MKVCIIQSVARFREAGGETKFIHKRAFTKKEDAEKFAPEFAKSIEEDKTGFWTYSDAKAIVSELELIE